MLWEVRGCQPHFTHGKMRFNNLPSIIEPGQGKPPRRRSLLTPLQGSPLTPATGAVACRTLAQPWVMALCSPPGPANCLHPWYHTSSSGSAQMHTGWGSKLPLGEPNPRLLTAQPLPGTVGGQLPPVLPLVFSNNSIELLPTSIPHFILEPISPCSRAENQCLWSATMCRPSTGRWPSNY